jgi:hypothetical protein
MKIALSDVDQMTDKEINEWIAVNIMGWESREGYYYWLNDRPVHAKANWNPVSDWNQCITTLNKASIWEYTARLAVKYNLASPSHWFADVNRRDILLFVKEVFEEKANS